MSRPSRITDKLRPQTVSSVKFLHYYSAHASWKIDCYMKLSSRDMRLLNLATKCTAGICKQGCTEMEGKGIWCCCSQSLVKHTCRCCRCLTHMALQASHKSTYLYKIQLYMQRSVTCMALQSCFLYRKLLSSGLNLKKFLKRRLGFCTAAASATELLPEACSSAMPLSNCTDLLSYCS